MDQVFVYTHLNISLYAIFLYIHNQTGFSAYLINLSEILCTNESLSLDLIDKYKLLFVNHNQIL